MHPKTQEMIESLLAQMQLRAQDIEIDRLSDEIRSQVMTPSIPSPLGPKLHWQGNTAVFT